MGVAWIIAAAVFFADFLIKTYLRTNFSYSSIPVIEKIFHITVVENSGAAFGFLRGKTTFLIYIGIVFIFVFLFVMKKEKKKGPLFLASCGLIIGGAISNLYDRIFLGFVIDYIDLQIWPVFNLSDSCITVGAFLLVWQSYSRSRHKPDLKKNNSTHTQVNSKDTST